MMRKIKVLYLTSENTTTSIPLELASEIDKSPDIEMLTATFYGRVKGDPNSNFSAPAKVIDLNVSGKNPIAGIKKINKVIKNFRPDVIHVHHNVSALLGLLVAKWNGVKLTIKTEHNDHRFFKWHQKILNIPILWLADIVICNSVSTKNSFYSWEKVLAGKNVLPIYNGIRTGEILKYSGQDKNYKFHDKYGISRENILFVSVARLITQKNFSTLIKAFSKASAQRKNISLLIVGDGNLKDDLITLRDSLEAKDYIKFTGVLPRDSVYQLINQADVFVISSLWEGFCNAAVEAMAASCPMLYSDIVTLREVIGDEVGKYVTPTSVDGFARGIIEFADMGKEQLNHIGEKSRNRALNNYSVEKTAALHIQQYKKSLNL